MTNSPDSSKERTMGRADVLFRFLQLMGKNRPKDVDEHLKQLDPDDESPIVDQLVDVIIDGDEQGYEKYNQARREVSKGGQLKEATKVMLPKFIEKWLKF